jgi:fructokinase
MKILSKKVLCIGEVLWDHLPDGKVPGGAPMNVGLHLHQLGHEVLIASSVGNDSEGTELLSFLRGAGVQTGLIQTEFKLPTSEVIVNLDEKNNPSYEIVEPVAWDNIELTNSLENIARTTGVVIYGSLASRNERTRNTIQSVLGYNSLKLIDVNLRPPYDSQEVVEPMIGYADIAKMNEEELITIASWHDFSSENLKELMHWFSVHFSIDMIVVTLGRDGAVMMKGKDFIENSGFKINEVDTVGAGDGFLAGFVSSLINGKEPIEALNFACATGSYVATKTGATPEYYMREIELILNQKKPA